MTTVRTLLWRENGRTSGPREAKTLTLSESTIVVIAMENICHLFADNHKNFPMPDLPLSLQL